MTHLTAGVLALAACSVVALAHAPDSDIEFVKISAGEFMMGCSPGDIDCKDDESPIHRVQITKPFEIGKYEVTQAQWEAVMGSNPSSIKGADRPVETITPDTWRCRSAHTQELLSACGKGCGCLTAFFEPTRCSIVSGFVHKVIIPQKSPDYHRTNSQAVPSFVSSSVLPGLALGSDLFSCEDATLQVDGGTRFSLGQIFPARRLSNLRPSS